MTLLVMTLLVMTLLVMTAIASTVQPVTAVAASKATSNATITRNFTAWGWLCTKGRRVTVLFEPVVFDTPVEPTLDPECSDGLPTSLPTGSAARRTIIKRATLIQPLGWRRSPTPLAFAGRATVEAGTQGGNIRSLVVHSAKPAATNRLRYLEALATPEIEPSRSLSSSISPSASRAEVFDRLPQFAEAIPEATIRTVRVFRKGKFGYLAHVRAANRPDLVSAVRRVSVAQSLPGVANPISATVLTAETCADAIGQVRKGLVGALLPDLGVTEVTCDELTQVVVINTPGIRLDLMPTFAHLDVVVHAALRVEP